MTHEPVDALTGLPQRRIAPVWFAILATATAIVALVLRLVDLNHVPAELYGDIGIVYDYLREIQLGHWPVDYVLSAGPLYHYLAWPLMRVFGFTFLGIKLASVVISLLGLVTLYRLGRDLLHAELGLLAAFIGAVSSWLLIFSRLGNSQILLPLLSTGALIFAVRLARWGQMGDAIACAVVSALGLYAYPQTFVMPPVLLFTLFCLLLTGTAVRWQHLLAFCVATIPCALPFGRLVARDPENFFSGYIGGKLEPLANPLVVLGRNILHALLAFNVHGDAVFRSNPASLPHLDPISGVLFLGGIVFWLWPPRWRLSPALLVPFLLLQVPSMLVLRYPNEVPSASRTLAVAPLAYLLAASGLWWLLDTLRRYRHSAVLLVAGMLLVIVNVNTQRYFDIYADGLPDHNTPFGLIVAQYIDALPADTQVLVAGCCWSEGSQPEPKSILYTMKSKHVVRFEDLDKLTCLTLAEMPRPAVLVWDPAADIPSPRLQRCTAGLHPQLYSSPRGGQVFKVSPLP